MSDTAADDSKFYVLNGYEDGSLHYYSDSHDDEDVHDDMNPRNHSYNHNYNHTFPLDDGMNLTDYSTGTGTGAGAGTEAEIGYGPALISVPSETTAAVEHTNPTTTIVYGDDRNWVVVGVLIALIVMLWVILGGMLCYPLVRCIKRRIPVSKRRINRRYDTIEGWLITKVVRPHDEACEALQNQYSKRGQMQQPSTRSRTTEVTMESNSDAGSPSRERDCADNTACDGDIEDQSSGPKTTDTSNTAICIKHTESTTTADTFLAENSFDSGDNEDDEDEHDEVESCNEDGRHECPICMECFVIGDVVSWSSYEKCSHVYHHQCIKEWLLRHNNCPFCREIFLPVDKGHKKITMTLFKELSDLRARRGEKTYFCIQDGLVTLDERAAKTTLSSCSTTTNTTTTTTCTTTTPNKNTVTSSSPTILRKCGHLKGRDSSSSSSPSEPKRQYSLLYREKLKPGITKAELKKLRGDRCEKICFGENNNTGEILDSTSNEIIEASHNSDANEMMDDVGTTDIEVQELPDVVSLEESDGSSHSGFAMTSTDGPTTSTGGLHEGSTEDEEDSSDRGDDSETSCSDDNMVMMMDAEQGYVEVDVDFVQDSVSSSSPPEENGAELLFGGGIVGKQSMDHTEKEETGHDIELGCVRVSFLCSPDDHDPLENRTNSSSDSDDEAIEVSPTGIEVDELSATTDSENENELVARRCRGPPRRLISF